MNETLEITVCSCYDKNGDRKIRMLRLLRIALIVCLFMSWTYAIAVAAAFVQEGSGAATLWMLQFVIFTIPATAVLVAVCLALGRLNRSFDYRLESDRLEIWNSKLDCRKLVVSVNCFSIAALAPETEAGEHHGRLIHAWVNKRGRWILDVRHEGQIVRILWQPTKELINILEKYMK